MSTLGLGFPPLTVRSDWLARAEDMLKLAYFVIERVAEPISERLESVAANSRSFRRICVQTARWQSKLDYDKRSRRHAFDVARYEKEPYCHGSASDDGPPIIPDLEPMEELTESGATKQGAELLGEAFVWSVGLGVLAHQYNSDRLEEAENEARIERNEARIRELEETCTVLRSQLDKLEASAPPRAAASSSWWRWRKGASAADAPPP